MNLARAAIALWAVSLTAASARTEFPQGIWAVGDASACGKRAVLIEAHDGAWAFTDLSGETRVQRVVKAQGRDYVTEPARGGPAIWSYHFDTLGSADVTDLWSQRSFRLVRCGVDSMIGLHATAD